MRAPLRLDGGHGFVFAGRGFADHRDRAVRAVGAERVAVVESHAVVPAPMAGVASTLPAAGSLTIIILLSQTE